MKKELLKKYPRLFISAVMLIIIAVQLVGWHNLESALPPQHAAERWRGDSGMEFAQISCFMELDDKLSVENVYNFRNEAQKKFKAAALEINGESSLYNDAWSTSGKVKVSGSHGSGDVGVTAVGGSFFDFHPLQLISGSYITENDLMNDRVLLDEETAWLIFGGQQLTGMDFTINGKPFVVAGVIRREDDRISTKAYTGGMGIFMSYEAFMRLDEGEDADYTAFIAEPGISCYEFVMAEPVKNFAYSLVQEKFPVKNCLVVKNSGRFDFENVVRIARQFGSRSMQTQGVILPYWENAARYAEDWCTVALLNTVLMAIFPLYLVISTVVIHGKRGKTKLSGELIPETKERIEEAIRLRQRARWEKKHPGWDRNTRK